LYKILFAKNKIIKYTYEFYSFIKNNYSHKNYFTIKIFRKNDKNSLFLQFFNKFIKKILFNMKISNNIYIYIYIYIFIYIFQLI